MGKKENKEYEQSDTDFDISKMDKEVRQRLLDEAAKIEEELGEDPYLDNLEPPRELFDKIVKEAREQGLLKEKKKIFHFPDKYVVAKWAAMIVITLAGVFGVTMTSQANRAYMMEKANRLFGDDTATAINNDVENVIGSNVDEETMRRDIQKKIGAPMPSFFYLPDGTEFAEYQIDEQAKMAYINFLLENKWFYLCIVANDKKANAFSEVDCGNLVGIEHSEYLKNTDIELWKIEEDGDTEPGYLAQWEYKNCYYKLSGKLGEEEIIKVLREIMYR